MTKKHVFIIAISVALIAIGAIGNSMYKSHQLAKQEQAEKEYLQKMVKWR